MSEINITYHTIISLENLYEAWREFIRDKKQRKDVADFSLNLSENIFKLHVELKNKTYNHGKYEAFAVNDPKPRSIHKATVRDRLLHHAVYRILYPFFDTKFIHDSYSCRFDKGTHLASKRFIKFFNKVSQNNHKTCWVLKCDIKKFFASIDHTILNQILKRHICDQDILWLIENIVGSFQSTEKGKGLPLGNLTSQLLVNIYMNEFDQWMKHVVKAKYYIRYADDFVILNRDKSELIQLISKMGLFLKEQLKLSLHPGKLYIKTFASGIDFLGWVHFPNHKVLRTATKKRMFKNLKKSKDNKNVLQSYLGLLSHGNTRKIRDKIFTHIDII
jgi:RNA-directed DNA polymerase